MSKTLRIPLVQLAHARSGDKADWVDFGLFAWNEAGYRILEREVTAAKVEAHFAPWLPGQVDAWPLPNILDNLGKAMGAALLRLEIEVNAEELAEAQKSPRRGWWPNGTPSTSTS
jgi:hypothetical protein